MEISMYGKFYTCFDLFSKIGSHIIEFKVPSLIFLPLYTIPKAVNSKNKILAQ